VCARRFAAEKELEAQPEDLDESPACRLFAGRGDTRNVLRACQKVILQRRGAGRMRIYLSERSKSGTFLATKLDHFISPSLSWVNKQKAGMKSLTL